MSDGRRKRLSMLDAMARPPGDTPPAPPPPAAAAAAGSRALRGAREAVDGVRVWELDPEQVVDERIADRLDPSDVADLRDAIEANGQTVPILVRRDPSDPDRYRLVYGRRRLEAIRGSATVRKVRALVASLDDDAAIRAQISENMARRDLTYIEKALLAQELTSRGYGTHRAIAEILTVARSAISMALAVVESVGRDLVQAIGPAPGIGRPRWEALAARLAETGADRGRLVEVAERAHGMAAVADRAEGETDPSVAAFEAVMAALPSPARRPTRGAEAPAPGRDRRRTLLIAGEVRGTLRRSPKGFRIDIEDGPIADWLEAEAEAVLTELHARWMRSGKKAEHNQ